MKWEWKIARARSVSCNFWGAGKCDWLKRKRNLGHWLANISYFLGLEVFFIFILIAHPISRVEIKPNLLEFCLNFQVAWNFKPLESVKLLENFKLLAYFKQNSSFKQISSQGEFRADLNFQATWTIQAIFKFLQVLQVFQVFQAKCAKIILARGNTPDFEKLPEKNAKKRIINSWKPWLATGPEISGRK